MKADAEPVSYTTNGLRFSDGSEIIADVITFCTGFEKGLREAASTIFAPEVSDAVGDLWGLDDEGELRGMYKRQACKFSCSTRHTYIYYLTNLAFADPGLFFTGGGVNHARFFARFVALQIQADILGTPLRTYNKKFYCIGGKRHV